MEETFRRRRALIALNVGGACLEAAVLPWVGLRVAAALSPQLTAVPPLGVFHDLRWLFVYHDSWLTFGLGAFGIVLARSALTTAQLRLAWPAGVPPPPVPATFASAAAFTLFAGALLSPMVTLLFGTAVVPFSWPYLAAVPAALLAALLVSHGAVRRDWWRRLPTLRSLGWLLTSFVVLSATSLVVTSVPPPVGVLAAAAAGLFNAWSWWGLTAALARRPPVRHRLPVAPAAAVALLLLVVVGARMGFVAGSVPQRVGRATGAAAAGAGQPVLVVGGFGSACCYKGDALAPALPGTTVRQFSYLGLDRRGRPRPHGAAASNQRLSVLAERLDRQVKAAAGRSGRQVDLVAESEGTLVALAYLSRHPQAPVGAVALLSPIVDPGRVRFPGRGQQGWGLAAGWELRGLLRLVSGISPFDLSPDGPLLGSIGTGASALALAGGCPPRWATLVLVPVADAVTLPLRLATAGEQRLTVVGVPAFHGGLLSDPDVRRQLADFFAGRPVAPRPGWTAAADVVSGVAAAWRVPPLAASLAASPARSLPGGCAAAAR